MIYLELMIATEDGEDWVDLVHPDEIDDIVNNWHDYDSPARLVSCVPMEGPRLDYALEWHNHPGGTLDDIVDALDSLFPIIS